MGLFNENSRVKNVLRTSGAGMINQVVKILGAFAYRTIFLMILTREHLGINGLFSNVLQIFSLAELGIGAAIVYRMYLPFARKDVNAIGALLRFYRRVYRTIALIVAGMSLVMFPFVRLLVHVEEIPADVNFVLVYFLFSAQSVSSYFFVYKQSLLSADQRGHTLALYAMGLELMGYVVKIAVLAATRSYVAVLAWSIGATVICNYLFSLWIDRQYAQILAVRENLPKAEQKQILKDTAGLMCHKVGTVVVNGTDNLVLTKCVGLAAVGLYSNYALITASLVSAIAGIASGLVPMVGNLAVNEDREQTYRMYLRCLPLGFWLASATTVCLYVLLNPFILVWQDETFLFSMGTVAVLCLQYFLQVSRIVSNVYVNGCGLFMRDRLRPLVESAVNLAVSVVLALRMGISGVFVGTVVSGLLTYYWREPYLLLREYFHKGGGEFCKILLGWWVLTAAGCAAFSFVCSFIPLTGWLSFFVRAVCCFVGINAVYALLMCRTDFFRFFLQIFRKRLGR